MTTIQQAIHIFKKDVRFLRIEIVVLAAVSAIFAWAAYRLHTSFEIPDTLAVDAFRYSPSYGSTNLTTLLVYLAAILLSVRVIHADPVPGTREFWFTRPYRWKSVLLAKAMFIVFCVNIPILLARTAIVVLDGFSLSQNLWGLIWTQVWMAFRLMVPAAALAAVTANLVTFIFAAVSLVAVELLIPALFNSGSPIFYGPIRTPIVDLFFFTLGIVVVYLQYRYRKTALSRALGAGVLALGMTVYMLVPLSFARDVQSRVWNKSTASSLQIAILPPVEKFLAEKGTISISLGLPVQLNGLQNDMAAIPNAIQVRIEGFENRTIDSGLASGFSVPGLPLLRLWNTRVEVPTILLETVHGKALTLHLSAYLSLFKKVRAVSVPYEANRWSEFPAGIRCFNGFFLHCEKPVTSPSQLITYNSRDADIVWFRPPNDPFASTLALNPVETVSHTVKSDLDSELTVWDRVGDVRRDIEIPNFPLTDYVDVVK